MIVSVRVSVFAFHIYLYICDDANTFHDAFFARALVPVCLCVNVCVYVLLPVCICDAVCECV